MFNNYHKERLSRLDKFKKKETHRRIQFLYQSYESFYQPMIDKLGIVELQENEEGYSRRDGEGQTRVVLSEGDKYGLLVFSWGNDYSKPDEIFKCECFDDTKRIKERLLISLMASSMES